jgi:hypothetical protein
MKILNLVACICCIAAFGPLKAHSQIYSFTEPISGSMTYGITDLNGGNSSQNLGVYNLPSDGITLTFNSLTETVYLDLANSTMREVGSIEYTPSASSQNLIINEPNQGEPAVLAVSLSCPATLLFDTGTFPIYITPNSGNPNWPTNYGTVGMYGCPFNSLSNLFNASYTLTTGGQTYSGNFSYTVSLVGDGSVEPYRAVDLTGYPGSITLLSQDDMSASFGSIPPIAADLVASNSFHMQLAAGFPHYGRTGTLLGGYVGDDFNLNLNSFAFSAFDNGENGSNSALAVNILSNGPPIITSFLPTNVIAQVGDTYVFNVSTIGIFPFTYQWFEDGATLTGATNYSLSLTKLQLGQAGNYNVVVANAFGSVTSGIASLAVAIPPAITIQPVGETVPAGSAVNLSVTASGTPPLYYQWVNSMGPISGATNCTFTINPAETNNWDTYFVIVNNGYSAVTSTQAPLIVYGPVKMDSQPLSQIVTLGSTTFFLALASGFPPPVYQWTFNGTNLPDATSNVLVITNIDLPNLGDYQALVYNAYSTNSSDSASLNLSPSLISPFYGATTIWGKPATFSVGAVGSGSLAYQWYFNGMPISGANGATLNFTSIQFTNGGYYSVVVSSPYGSATNGVYEVVVNPANVTLGFYPGLTIGGVEGYSYIIQSSTNLANPSGWVTLTNLTLTQPIQLWMDTNVNASSPFNSKTFYKILPGQ